MLSKKDVLIFAERMQDNAEKAVKEDYNNARKIVEERIIHESGAEETIKNMQCLMNQMIRENGKLNEVLEGSQEITYCRNYSNGLTRRFSDMENIKNYAKNHMSFESSELVRLKLKYDETKDNIMANYEAVKAEIKNKTNAKRALEYLKEIGFDVAPLEQMQKSEIAVKLDKRYLFFDSKA